TDTVSKPEDDTGTEPDPSDAAPEPADVVTDASSEDVGPACDPAACAGDDPCVQGACVEGECVQTPIEGCCTSAVQCNDDDLCTLDSCGDANICEHTVLPDCCSEGTPCDDGDPCTTDACGDDFSCLDPVAIEGCCQSDDECDDANPCTTNTCAELLCAEPVVHADGDPCDVDGICVGGECVATPVCGDGEQGFGEACDDGGTTPGDGCSMTCTVEDFQVGDIIFTEFMPNPSAVLDAEGEWVEVYNTTDADIDINGWTLTESNENPHVITSATPVIVPAGSFFVLTLRCDPADNGGIEPGYCYDGVIIDGVLNPEFILNNDVDTMVLGWNGIVVDTLSYDGSAGWAIAQGVSTQLSNASLDDVSNDDSAAWCASTATFGDGDLGSPGEDNEACP
ncbi:MAG: lamin tail domain-containing protein, partial [Myxococcota bacterium]|nr:lamin tail domain-containing protein [Myxococcota bacterium]